jgi:autotransporter-associated beta strand protein
MKPKNALARLIGLSPLICFQLHAGTTWDGGGTTDNWSDGANWSPDGFPPVGSGIDLNFAGSTRLNSNNNYTAWDDFRSFLFDSGAGAFTLTGNAVDLFGKIENNSTATQTVSLAELSLNTSAVEFNPVSGNLVITSANLYNNGNTLNVWGNNGHTLTFTGVKSGSGGLTINQNSQVVLTGENTFTGATTISAGSLRIGNGGTSGNLGTGTVTNNASLVLNRSNDFTFANAISGTGTLTQSGGGITDLTGANTFSGKTSITGGTLSIDSDSRLGNAPGSAVADQITIAGGSLRITGGSTVSLSGNRGITIGAGGATLDNSGMGSSLNANFNQIISGSGPLALRANGSTAFTGGGVGGNLTLGSSANTFTGDVTIHSGVVNFTDNGSFGNTANDIILAGGGLVATSNRTLPSSRDIVLSGGGDRIFRAYGGVTFTVQGAITGAGNVVHTDGGTLVLAGSNSWTGNLVSAAGSGRVVALAAPQAYTGYTHVRETSTLRLDADNVLPDAAYNVFWGGTVFNINGRTDTTGAVTTGSAGDSNVVMNLGSGGNLTVTNNNLVSGTFGGYSNATWSGRIVGSGTLTYAHATATGGGVHWDIMNGTNDFTGNWVIRNGRLRFASDAAMGNLGNDVVFDGLVETSLANGGGRASLQVANGTSLNHGADRTFTLNAGKEGTFYVWGGTTQTVNGQITGGGNLRKEDGGVLLLNNATNDYSGLTRIAVGTVRLGVSGALPSASGVEIAGGNLDLNSLNASAASLFGTGGAVNGGGVLTVSTSGTATYSGIIQNDTTLHMAGTGTQTIAGTADNNSGRASVSSGTLVLAKASSATVHAIGRSFAVGLTISGGTARLGGSGNDQIYTQTDVSQSAGTFDFNGTNEGIRGLIGAGGVVTNNAAATVSTLTFGESTVGTDSFTYGGVIQDGTGTMAVTKTGLGTQFLTGVNTFTGDTVVAEGRLIIDGSLASDVIVGNGVTAAAIGGDGVIHGDVTLGANGTILAGTTGSRSLVINGNISTVAGSTLSFTIDSESTFDQLGLTNSLDLSDTNLAVTLNDTSFVELGAGQGSSFLTSGATFYKIIDGPTSGMFSNVTETLSSGELSYLGLTGTQYTTFINGQKFWVATGSTYLVAIPEPTVPLLAALGSFTLVFRRRRI